VDFVAFVPLPHPMSVLVNVQTKHKVRCCNATFQRKYGPPGDLIHLLGCGLRTLYLSILLFRSTGLHQESQLRLIYSWIGDFCDTPRPWFCYQSTTTQLEESFRASLRQSTEANAVCQPVQNARSPLLAWTVCLCWMQSLRLGGLVGTTVLLWLFYRVKKQATCVWHKMVNKLRLNGLGWSPCPWPLSLSLCFITWRLCLDTFLGSMPVLLY